MRQEKENWIDIHPDFAKKDGNKTFQQLWEEAGLTFQDAQEWINIDWKPSDYKKIKNWRNHGFTAAQVQEWISSGLTKNQHELAYYLKKENCQNDEESRKKFDSWFKDLTAQKYLDYFYPLENRNVVTELNINGKNLTDSLNISNFINLRELDCSHNYSLAALSLVSNPQLIKLECNGCQLTNLVINNCEKLTELNCSYNKLVGSCEIFQNLSKLKKLNIDGNDINSGLEYLPDSLEKFVCNDQLKEKLKDYDWDIKKWREFYSQSQKWINENYPKQKREEIFKLDISSKKLEGELILLGFGNLQELDCSNNQLTKLDLRDCSNLKKLNISDCHSLEGSLIFLKSLEDLRELNITNTDLSEGLEYLPVNCKKLICNSDSKYSSVEIIRELKKSKCLESSARCYNFDSVKFAKWRIDKQNGMIASIIPLERLYVIRGNMNQFLKKWGKKPESNWYDKFWTKQENSELSLLKDPNTFNKYWLLTTGIQWTNRAVSVVGGSLLLVGANNEDKNNPYNQTGGIIAIVSPFIEVITSQIKANAYETKEKKWNEFLVDADTFLDNYNELLGILGQFGIEKLEEKGEVNKALKDLDKSMKNFLNMYDGKYDKKEDGEIDINELVKERDEFTRDLSGDKEKSKAWEIVSNIKNLGDAVIKYRQIKYFGKSEGEDKEKDQLEPSDKNQQIGNISETKDNSLYQSSIEISEDK